MPSTQKLRLPTKTTKPTSPKANVSLECAESSESSSEKSGVSVESEHFFFGAELTGEATEFIWNMSAGAEGNDAEKEDDEDDAVRSTLQLRQVALGKGAKEDERNIVQVTTRTTECDNESYVIACLRIGMQEMCQLWLDFHGNSPVTLSLIEGSGPICVTGHYTQENEDKDYDYNQSLMDASEEECDEEEEVEIEDEEVEEEEVEILKLEKPSTLSKKEARKIENDENLTETRGIEQKWRKEAKMEDGDSEESEEEEEEEEEEDEMESSKVKPVLKFKAMNKQSPNIKPKPKSRLTPVSKKMKK